MLDLAHIAPRSSSQSILPYFIVAKQRLKITLTCTHYVRVTLSWVKYTTHWVVPI